MSSSFYPQGMNSYNNRLVQSPLLITTDKLPLSYTSWKGRGVFSNPVGVTSSHVRPLTNKDPGNVFPTGFGLPRPIKHYRRGTVIPVPSSVFTVDPNDPAKLLESSLIEYNTNRSVKSSTGISLGGGDGGLGLIGMMISTPGSFIVKDNLSEFKNNIGVIEQNTGIQNDSTLRNFNKIDDDCKTCQGVGLVSGWYPINNLTEKPELNVTNPLLCCNQQRKAIQRVLPTSTLVKKNYYQTTGMYLYNRCQTFKQREFNFLNGSIDPKLSEIEATSPYATNNISGNSKPGAPLSTYNLYVAQCNPNFTVDQGAQVTLLNLLVDTLLEKNIINEDEYKYYIELQIDSLKTFYTYLDSLSPIKKQEAIIFLDTLTQNPYVNSILFSGQNTRGCKRVYYKPNNPQFAQQGAVSSSTRTLKLDVTTIEKNAYKQKQLQYQSLAFDLQLGQAPEIPFINKMKTPKCQASTYVGNPFFFQGQKQNRNICPIPKNIQKGIYESGDIYNQYVTVYQRAAGNYIGATQP